MRYRALLFVVSLVASSLASAAGLEWAVWGPIVGSGRTGSFTDGRTVQLTGFVDGSGAPLAGTEYTSDPAIPGTVNSRNPSFVRVATGTIGGTINENDVIATIDLDTVIVDPATAFGIADQRYGLQYRLEIRDVSQALLSLDNVVVTPYNLTYDTDSLIADYNSQLIGGVLYVDGNHDAGGFYLHTGLTTISNLPATARSITLVSNVFQNVEGIQLYMGTTVVPAPAGIWLLGTAIGALGLRRAIRRR